MKKVEQIHNGTIVQDFDEKLNIYDIRNILSKDFGVQSGKNPYECSIGGKIIRLFVKQITYLGHPHPIFKKRIQISKGWASALKEDKNAYLVGIYKYKNTIIYTVFDKTNYIKRITNNSSAHIFSYDLAKAYENGISQKTDIRGNVIHCVNASNIKCFFRQLVLDTPVLSEEQNFISKFARCLQKKWHGKQCYQEMVDAKYNNKYQSEWVGFYLEFKFQKYLDANTNLKDICTFQTNKKQGDLDLDLNFHNYFLGDLKTHSNSSNAILGNDEVSIKTAIRRYSRIWYVVFNHDTVKDADLDNYEVTLFWNKLQNKPNLMSYSKKMKNNITLTQLQILELTKFNIQHLSAFNQGKNSNGLDRKSKIKIKKKDITNFLIYQENL